MAGKGFYVRSTPVTLTASTPKTAIEVTPAVNDQIFIREINIAGSAQASGTDAGVHVVLSRATGTETAVGTTVILVADDPKNGLPFATTALNTITTEPTTVTVIDEFYIQPESGLYPIKYPLANPLVISGGTSGVLGHFYITLTAGSTETITVTVRGEE
jgi:hypothetical protein